MGPDGDDDEEMETKQAPPISVTYVDFDKTKPYSQKQIGDGHPHSTSKTNSKLVNSSKHQLKNSSAVVDNQAQTVNGKSGCIKTKNVESEISMTEKNKIKRQSRLLDSEQKLTEAPPKLSKKHKRDVQ